MDQVLWPVGESEVFVRPRMVDPTTCRALCSFAGRRLEHQPTDGIAALKYEEIPAHGTPDEAEIKRLMNSFRFSAIHQVRGHFDGVGRCLPSTTLLTMWRQGCGLAPHCDTDTWWRSYTTICYLNDDFDGGELEFVKTGLRITPEPGLFVAFRSDSRDTLHLVRPVSGGSRFTLSAFLTRQIERVEL